MVWIQKLFSKPKERPETNFKRLGLVKGEEDKRDYVFSLATSLMPKKFVIPCVDVYNQPTLPVRNQLNIGSCASHTAIRAYEIMLKEFKSNKFLEGSELYHYYNARKFVNETHPADSGMTIRDACKTLHKFHMATEYAYPYIPAKFNVKPPVYVYWTSGAYKVLRYESLTTLYSIKTSIAQKIPVLCGIWIYESYYKLNQQVYVYQPKGNKTGAHAQLIVGYDDDKKELLLSNSWGSGWGLKGYCVMKYEDFLQHSFDYWRILI